MNRIKVYHFHNGSGGGVLSVIKNLVEFSKNEFIDNHIIYTINKETTKAFELPTIKGTATQQIFYYSPKWNFYYTCKQLAKLLPDDKAVIVSHDWLELGMVSNLGLQNPVVQILHGGFDYYYELSCKHQKSIDKFVTVSPVILSKLSSILPERKEDIVYCRFPVPSIKAIKNENEILKIFYCVWNLSDHRKQFKLLPLINASLKSKKIKVYWTIVGEGKEKNEVENLMGQHSDISIFSSLTNKEVTELLPGHDLFILPSIQEGFPVAVVEAMKAGAVPLVTDWEGATKELIIEGESGYYFETGDTEGYVNAIRSLNEDRKLLKDLSQNGIEKANKLFDPFINTKKIEEVIYNVLDFESPPKKAFHVYGSRLDKSWIPNFLVKTFR